MSDHVYFYGTCLIDLYYPNAGMASIKLLQDSGVNVIYPPAQSCCGQPAYNSGYRDEALDVVAAQLGLFSENIPLVVPSASCADMIKNHWPSLFEHHALAGQAQAIASRTYELTEFLVNVLQFKAQDLGEPIQVAVHSSCSALRKMQVAVHINSLLKQLKNVEVIEHEYKTECCGFGGTFAIKQADISGAMVEAKTTYLQNTGASRVISQDCGCLMNIGGALQKQQSRMQTQHIAEFLLERCS